MTVTHTSVNGSRFDREAIERQLDKIFQFPVFTESAILRKFLEFIVGQTLDGNENCVKEYTIAINVLGKPAHFKPHENGIVRIHAGRLRRALHRYYEESGDKDAVYISVPKGKYLPCFSDKRPDADGMYFDDNSPEHHVLHNLHRSPIFAVLPFRHSPQNELLNSLAEGVSMQLSTSLSRDRNYSVVAYQAVAGVCDKRTDIKEVCEKLHADIIIDGNFQLIKDHLRINFQIIRTSTMEQVWGEMFERKLTPATIFPLQDEIVRLAVTAIESRQIIPSTPIFKSASVKAAV